MPNLWAFHVKHEIRQVTNEDIKPFMNQGKKEGLSFVRNTDFYAAFDEGAIVGYCGIRWFSNRAVFRNLWVSTDVRGQGLGTTLIRFQISKSREMAKTKAIAYTNWNSKKLYISCGGRLKDSERYYGLIEFDLTDRYRVRGL